MPGMEYIPKLKEVEGVEGGGSSPSNMTRRLKMTRLGKIATTTMCQIFATLAEMYQIVQVLCYNFKTNANTDKSIKYTANIRADIKSEQQTMGTLHCRCFTKVLECIPTKQPI